MADRPRSLPAFAVQFADDAACARWLFEKRWPDGFRCPGCGHDKGWELGRGLLLVECGQCHRQTSLTAGTVLHRSHLPLRLDRKSVVEGKSVKRRGWRTLHKRRR